jgi:isoleucyl-tRNA synthetase
MGTLWNTYAFFVLYANIDKYNPADYDIKKCKLTLMDKWLLSKLNSLIKKVDKGLNDYDIFGSSRELQAFVDDLSNWYVRRGRERYWGKDMTEDKAAAYTTLYTVLVTLAKLTAPYTPFMAENIYSNLVPNFFKDAPISVHLCSFPVADESYIDETLNKGMEDVLEIVVLGRACRNAGNIKNRQPLSKLYVCADRAVNLSADLLEIAKDELNVKEFEYLDDASAYVKYKIKPQLKTLGPKYGAKLGLIRKLFETANANEIVATVKSGKNYAVNFEGEDFEFSIDDLLISSEKMEGYSSESANGITVVLDTRLTEELIREGNERDIISKIQSLRKEAGFEVTDRICIYLTGSAKIQEIMATSETIKSVVLADGVFFTEGEGYTKELDLCGEACVVTLKKSK